MSGKFVHARKVSGKFLLVCFLKSAKFLLVIVQTGGDSNDKPLSDPVLFDTFF